MSQKSGWRKFKDVISAVAKRFEQRLWGSRRWRKFKDVISAVAVSAVIIFAIYGYVHFYNQPLNQLNDDIAEFKKELGTISLLDRLKLTKDILAIKKDQVVVKNSLYTPLIQGLGTLGLFATAYVGYKNFVVARENGQVERFSKANEKLEASTSSLRRTGVYSLERVMNDCPDQYHEAIVDILTTFVVNKYKKNADEQATKNQQIEIDVLTAIEVLSRRDSSKDKKNRTIDLVDIDLSHIDLSGLTLKKFQFNDTFLTEADLAGANLTDVNLTGAILIGANLTSADLTGANLTGANLTGANLSKAKLSKAKLIGTTLTEATLTDADLTEADLTTANFTSAILREADFKKAKLANAILIGVNLTGADLTGANLTGANLTGADLTGAILTKADLTTANFTSAILREADFKKAELADANFTDADFTGAKNVNCSRLTEQQSNSLA
jgi:uncharacterized protein YjbI with pentapeptide repeats